MLPELHESQSISDRQNEKMNSGEINSIRGLGICHILIGPCSLVGLYFVWPAATEDDVLFFPEAVILAYLAVVGISLLTGGIGIMARKQWALPFMRTAGILLLLFFPFGTVLGVWTLAVHSKLSLRRQKLGYNRGNGNLGSAWRRYGTTRLLRYLLLPILTFILITGFAWNEWAQIAHMKKAAESLRETSKIHVFTYLGEKQWQGRLRHIYQYEVAGKRMEFPTYAMINLPPDGRVRVGMDPLWQDPGIFKQSQQPQIVVPLIGGDTVEALYEGLSGQKIGAHRKKAYIVSAAALFVGVAGFFLQRTIFRHLR